MTTAPAPDARACIVTGSAGWLGGHFCNALAATGATIIGFDRADHSRTLALLGDRADQLTTLSVDLTNPEQVSEALSEAASITGGIDVLVNNAGLAHMAGFDDTSYADWRAVMASNLDAVYLVTHAAIPYLRASRAGRIVNVSSAVVWLGPAGMVAYTTAKAGLIGFTRALASELGGAGITVNAFTAGIVPPPGAMEHAADIDALVQKTVAMQSVPRVGTPDDLISTLLFLASPDSGFVTGTTVNVDGGFAKH